MIERKTICYSDVRVIEAIKNCKNASRFFEEAAIYYIESITEERISKEMIKDIVIECLKGCASAQIQISNPNYSLEQIDDDINDILNL